MVDLKIGNDYFAGARIRWNNRGGIWGRESISFMEAATVLGTSINSVLDLVEEGKLATKMNGQLEQICTDSLNTYLGNPSQDGSSESAEQTSPSSSGEKSSTPTFDSSIVDYSIRVTTERADLICRLKHRPTEREEKAILYAENEELRARVARITGGLISRTNQVLDLQRQLDEANAKMIKWADIIIDILAD